MGRKMIGLLTSVFLVAMLLLGIAAPRAMADTVTYSLSNGNPALSGYSGPYGTVEIDLTSSTTATIKFTADSGVLFSDGSLADFNINGTANVSVSTFTQLAGFNTASIVNAGSGQVDGFGNFNYTSNNSATPNGYSSAVTGVTFSLTATGNTTWSSASDVLTANNGGSTFAAHVYICNTYPDTCVDKAHDGSAAVTGYAANGNQVPEPASLLLFGSGLLSLGGFVRRRKKQTKNQA